jgi:hypothetical protein
MAKLPQERLSNLRSKIENQRKTVDALKRDGHECADAERQLSQMVAEWRASENASPPS